MDQITFRSRSQIRSEKFNFSIDFRKCSGKFLGIFKTGKGFEQDRALFTPSTGLEINIKK